MFFLSHQTRFFRLLGWFVVFSTLAMDAPASAQLPSAKASVGLVAYLPESVTVQYRFFPMAQFFEEEEGSPAEILHVFLGWRLREGQNIQVRAVVESGVRSRRVLSSPGFVSIERLALEPFPSAFQPTAQTGGSLLATLVGGEKKSVGSAGLIVGVDGESETENSTLRITVSVL